MNTPTYSSLPSPGATQRILSFIPIILTLLLLLWSPAGRAALPAPITLDRNSPLLVGAPVATWLESGADMTIEGVSQMQDQFEIVPALHREPLNETRTLWIHLRLVRASESLAARWTLNIPLPFIDDVRFYQRDNAGQWQEQTAGDTLPQSAWSLPGLYPEARIDLPDTQVRDVYVRIRNFKHLSVPLRLAPYHERAAQRTSELLLLGLLLGVLGWAVAHSLVRFAEHRNTLDLSAAGFSFLVFLTTAEVNGVLNMTALSQWPAVGNYAYAVLPMLAIGSMLLMLRILYAMSTHYSRYDRLLKLVGWIAILSPVLNVYDRQIADAVCILVFILATTTGLIATFLSWRGDSRIWYWLVAAYVPQYLCLIRITLESSGLLPVWWEMRYLLSLSMATAVPVMLYALEILTHERNEMRVRARHLSTQDALTGLLNPAAFQRELEKAYDRVVDERQHMAVVLVKVANIDNIRQAYGDAVAEKCLLQAVVKLYRVARDVDPVARIDAGHFALILEGMSTAKKLNERLVQLLASGLTPLRGIHPPVVLIFHAGCLLLHENTMDPDNILPALDMATEGAALRTRRPIRYVASLRSKPSEFSSSIL